MECSCINQNPNLPIFLLCEIIHSTHKLIYFVCENQTKQSCFSVFIKPILHVKHDFNMQYVKQHDNLGNLPNEAPITSGVGYNKQWLFHLSHLN